MRVAATVASRRSSILPILLGAMKAVAAISTQSSTKPAQIQFLLSDANADMGAISSVYEWPTWTM
jgi:hypothetical protein